MTTCCLLSQRPMAASVSIFLLHYAMVHTPYHSDFVTVCWFLYLIRTADNRLYTGITTDVPRRFRQHQAGKGAKALRGKGDLQLAFSHEVGEHSLALRLEYRVKQLTKREKSASLPERMPSKPCWQGLKTIKVLAVFYLAMDAVEGVIRQTVNLERLGAVRPAAAEIEARGRFKAEATV